MSLMLQEITEQPEVLEKTIRAESGKYEKLKTFLRQRDVDLIVLVARGSSSGTSCHTSSPMWSPKPILRPSSLSARKMPQR